jgi:hypothetical protein
MNRADVSKKTFPTDLLFSAIYTPRQCTKGIIDMLVEQYR